MYKAPHIWLTRPLADSESLAAELTTHGIASIIAPVLGIAPHAVTIPTDTAPAAIILTSRHSAHALATLPESWRAQPVYCVGDATAQAVAAQGFSNIIAGDADVLALLPRIAADVPVGSRLLYLAGEETRVDIAALLGAQQIQVETHVAYRATAINTLPGALCTALSAGHVSGIALFSPRSAAIASQLLASHGLEHLAQNIDAYCLSLAVAHTAAATPWARLHTCHQPTRAAMVDLIVSHRHKTL